ncbi:murein L,D-transpeptidase catalytic domain family protein [Marinobacter halodurans]|uniref:Murein L,D-transpeptidase catalytic domain family protein n=1 Tax=Marinobacter halodurans TaxID=2528979 RepID=A0ABY1ZNN8_9GAMM|nr:murein L,D-transpeptidase catalytic domain family protein [Marinobacter halodurans]TBW55187.1 murein L,D-transpeptidase catalytic domain family protein [Marinobacter halodurans]
MIDRRLQRVLAVVLGVLFSQLLALQSHAAAFDKALYNKLSKAAPNLSHKVLQQALQASECAVSHGIRSPKRLAVIDFSLPSSEKRLWLLDLETGALVLRGLVAHGKNSGMTEATAFSNVEGSFQSSIGLFQAGETYRGRHGYALRLDGLEKGVNDLARQRAIVIHGAEYVAQSWVQRYGRIGRSHGCPAVSNKVIRQVVDNLKGGQLVFTYYPDQEWLQSSSFLHCGSTRMAGADDRGDDSNI